MSGSAESVLAKIRAKRVAEARTAAVPPLEPAALNSRAAAAFLGITAASLKAWRHQRRGPPFKRLGPTLIVYETRALRAWLAAAGER